MKATPRHYTVRKEGVTNKDPFYYLPTIMIDNLQLTIRIQKIHTPIIRKLNGKEREKITLPPQRSPQTKL